MIYEDFNICIVADGQDYALHAAFRESRETGALSLPSELFSGSGSSSANAPGHPREVSVNQDREDWAERIGQHLFLALFQGNILRLFEKSGGEINSQPSHGLRLRIHFDLSEERLLPLLSLPWELLRYPQDARFLGLDRRTPLVRSLNTARILQTLPIEGRLRVLIAMAAPAQTAPLELAGERTRIEEALSQRKEIDLTVLEHTTPKALRRHIRGKKYHVIHYMGHGEHSEEERSGALVLESEERTISPLTASALASFFNGIEQPALVVLNACRTASAPPGLGPLTSVAAALVAEGLPAVLAMRTNIEDQTALELSEELYLCLAAGEPVEAALTEARLAIHTSRPAALDWAIPALFVRGPAPPLLALPTQEMDDERSTESDSRADPRISQSFRIGKVGKFENVNGTLIKNHLGCRR